MSAGPDPGTDSKLDQIFPVFGVLMAWQKQSLWKQERDTARRTFKLGFRPSELPRKRTVQKNVPGIA